MTGQSRGVGGTEYSWCKAVRGGTGIAVLALLISKPLHIPHLQNALIKLQNYHPILRSRLVHSEGAFSFVTSHTPFVKIESHDLSATSQILEGIGYGAVSPFQGIMEHELNKNTWRDPGRGSDMFVASIYEVAEAKFVVVMRLHVAACDRTTAVSLLRELVVLLVEGEEEGGWNEGGDVSLAVEDILPSGKGKKGIVARGMDVIGYSVKSVRQTNLRFNDTKGKRYSQVVRLQLSQNDTKRVLDGCKRSRIKLCGALSAAGLMAAHSYMNNTCKKYGLIILTDCRSTLDPPLSFHNFGFYHSAILNNHVMKGGEKLWDLAKRTYGSFANSKNSNKHFSDMADMNFLMSKAIDNPGLTSSSSLRTSIMSVFEETVIEDSSEMQDEIGLEDYMGCASVHGVGPSIAMFDTIRDGRLDCVCVYPAPLHSREQMQHLVTMMKAILIEAGNTRHP